MDVFDLKYYDEQQLGAVREAFEKKTAAWPGIGSKKMFGCPCYTSSGAMFAFFANGGIVFTQLSEEQREALTAKHENAPFDTGTRVMRKWPLIKTPSPRALTPLLPFARMSFDNAAAARRAKGAEKRKREL